MKHPVHTILKVQNMYLLCSFECVVCVHDGMDQVIHSNKPPGSGSVFRIWIPTIQQYCNMVIPEKKQKNTVFLLFFPFFFINWQSKGDFWPQACIRGLGNKFCKNNYIQNYICTTVFLFLFSRYHHITALLYSSYSWYVLIFKTK